MADQKQNAAAAGVIVALLGLLPLGWFFTRPTEDEQPPPAPTTVAEEELKRVPVEVAPPSVTDIDPVISRVLYAEGNADAIGESDSSGLPPEVVRVLVYYDVTLVVPVGPSDQEAGS